jgi:hypothetical protein
MAAATSARSAARCALTFAAWGTPPFDEGVSSPHGSQEQREAAGSRASEQPAEGAFQTRGRRAIIENLKYDRSSVGCAFSCSVQLPAAISSKMIPFVFSPL